MIKSKQKKEQRIKFTMWVNLDCWLGWVKAFSQRWLHCEGADLCRECTHQWVHSWMSYGGRVYWRRWGMGITLGTASGPWPFPLGLSPALCFSNARSWWCHQLGRYKLDMGVWSIDKERTLPAESDLKFPSSQSPEKGSSSPFRYHTISLQLSTLAYLQETNPTLTPHWPSCISWTHTYIAIWISLTEKITMFILAKTMKNQKHPLWRKM